MGKILKTVFGSCGVVSNITDLVKVPQMIEQTKVRIGEVKEALDVNNRHLAEFCEESISRMQVDLHLAFTAKERELVDLETVLSKMQMAKAEYADVFGADININLDAQISMHERKINECKEQLQSIRTNYNLHTQERETKQQCLEQEKKELEQKLDSLNKKLIELQEKKTRKHEQLNNNLTKLF